MDRRVAETVREPAADRPAAECRDKAPAGIRAVDMVSDHTARAVADMPAAAWDMEVAAAYTADTAAVVAVAVAVGVVDSDLLVPVAGRRLG